MTRANLAALMGVTLALGCDATTVKAQPGKLGNAVFGYLCTNESDRDPFCDFSTASTAFPKILLGGTFYVGAVTTHDTHDEDFVLQSASPSRLTLLDAMGAVPECTGAMYCDFYQPFSATALGDGLTSLIARGSAGHKDFADVTAEAAASLSITQITLTSSGKVASVGGPIGAAAAFKPGQVALRAVPYGKSKSELAGRSSDAYVWTTTDAKVVSIATGISDHLVTLTLGAPGMATVKVTLGTVSSSTAITVK